jgi:hypothetical protein
MLVFDIYYIAKRYLSCCFSKIANCILDLAQEFICIWLLGGLKERWGASKKLLKFALTNTMLIKRTSSLKSALIVIAQNVFNSHSKKARYTVFYVDLH